MKRKIVSILLLTILIGNLFLGNIAIAISENTQNIQKEEINITEKEETTASNEEEENNEIIEEEKIEEPIQNEQENIETQKDEVEEVVEEEVMLEENNIPEEPQPMSLENESEQVIKDGIYRIAMHTNNHYGVEIANASKNVEANVQLGGWINRNNNYKKFKITYDIDSGYYTIQNLNSGHVLDVQNGGMVTGTNIWQHGANGTDAQKWKIEKNEDGSYSFVSKKNGLYMDVQNGNIAEGGNLQMCMGNGTAAQKFDLICLDDKLEKTVESGIYKIALKENNNMVVQTEKASKVNGGNINIGSWIEKASNSQRRFEITYQEEDGYYIIKSINSGKVLDAYNGGTTNGTNIWQYAENDTDAQRWKIERNEDGSYRLANKKSGLYLDVAGGIIQEEQNIQLYQKTDSVRQKFDLIPVVTEKTERTIDDGLYRISSFGNEQCHMALEIENASKEVGANVQMGLWFNKNNEKNKFQVTYDEAGGYYTIQNSNSGNVLDVQNGIGPNIWQHRANGTDAQKWKIEKNDDGSYSFKSQKNGLYISVQNTNIQLEEGNDGKEQKFQFISLDNIPKPVIEDGIYKIESAENQNQVIEVKDKAEANGANIQIGSWKNAANAHQKVQITYHSDDGHYTIKALNSGKVWDAQNGGMISGTNIWQYDGNDTDAQRWKIEKNENETYQLINKKSGLYLSIEGTNIQINQNNNSKQQQFKIIPVEKTNPEEYIEEGTYKIVVASRQDLAIDVAGQSREKGANIVLGKASNNLRNEFNVIADENGYYRLSSINSGNVLDVQNGTGPNVWQHGNNGTDAQKWSIIHNSEDNTYSIVSKKNGLYLDVQNGNVAEGGNIQVCVGNNTAAQKFKFIKQGDKTEKYIEEGKYKIVTKLNTNMGFDIEAANKEDGAVAQIWTYQGAKQQEFEVKYMNGYYYMINLNSNKTLQTYGNKIGQWTIDGNNDDQKWMIKPNGTGYSLIAKGTTKAIEIPNANAQNGIDLQMNQFTGNDNQTFYFEIPRKVELETGYYGSSGLRIKGDGRGSELKYYKIGNGPNVFFGTFAVHGFEDLWNYDGQELTKIAEAFKDRLLEMQDFDLADKWTIYLFPSVNPDGEYYGYTNNGPGRTCLYSTAPGNKGIDINRCWSTAYQSATSNRNYNGSAPFQSYEAVYLRDFLLSRRATNGQTILVDLHGWLNETIGDDWIGSFYRNQYGMGTHISSYGSGYLINWARANLGYNGRTARATLVELPEVANANQVSVYGFSEKYINATLNMLRSF